MPIPLCTQSIIYPLFGIVVRAAANKRVKALNQPARIFCQAALLTLAALAASAVLTATPSTTASLYVAALRPAWVKQFVRKLAAPTAGKLVDRLTVRHLRAAGYRC